MQPADPLDSASYWRPFRDRTTVVADVLPFHKQYPDLLATACLGAAGAAPFIPGLGATVAVLVVANFGAGVWIAMYLTMAQEVSNVHVSTAAGLLGGSGSLAGAFLMRMVGVVTHQTNSFVIPALSRNL